MKILTAKPSQTRESKQQSCGCEEPELHDDLCSLSCVERPQFFYGQVLNDQDLTAIVNYTRQRLALRRFYEGWGVVSGLRTYIDPEKLLSVVVQPGMAIDCCGEDIVLCAPLRVDLSCLVTEGGDCLTPDEEKLVTATPQFAVDLYVHHTEKLTDLRTSLTRRSSSDLVCEYSRAVESACVKLQPIYNLEEPNKEAEVWYKRLLPAVDRVHSWAVQVGAYLSLPDKDERERKLTLWLRENPARQFDAVSVFGDRLFQSFPQILSLMLIERVNELLYAYCESIPTCEGVRIARVFLKRNKQTRTYSVQYIHNQAPMRQVLSRTCSPTPFGYINIAPIIGNPIEEATQWLADRGIRFIDERKRLPVNIEELMATLNAFWVNVNDPNPADIKQRISQVKERLFALPASGEKDFVVRSLREIPGTGYEPVILFDFPFVETAVTDYPPRTELPVELAPVAQPSAEAQAKPPKPKGGSKRAET
ncbi:MAG: hypothetical protein J0M07_12905 [Anaerolineae bacterium]|nr:hypothetical protein [Anaerolineae bacterium]